MAQLKDLWGGTTSVKLNRKAMKMLGPKQGGLWGALAPAKQPKQRKKGKRRK